RVSADTRLKQQGASIKEAIKCPHQGGHQMSPLVRWILAIVLALVLLVVVVGIGYFGLLLIAFGADSCSEVGNDASVSLLMAAPAVMALGVVVAAILFGLNKRWPWWVGALAAGAALGMCGYVSWFALVSQWCG
ncbi:MAG: hypothetical protein WBF31_19005, partial [Anaerolineae bacterium]